MEISTATTRIDETENKASTIPAMEEYYSVDSLLLNREARVDKVLKNNADKEIRIIARSNRFTVSCPCCGQECLREGGGFQRVVRDLPLVPGYTTIVEYHGRKAVCDNPNCFVNSFEEPVPFAEKNSHFSWRLIFLMIMFTLMMSYSSAETILNLIGVDVSHDTLRNLMLNPDIIHLEEDPDVEEIGVDDVSNHKGLTYFTAIYRKDNHTMLALLDGRDGKAFREWLLQHKKVRLVMRDRASAFATAVEDVCRELGIQVDRVADRFHLIDNIISKQQNLLYNDLPLVMAFKTDGEQITKLDKIPQKLVRFNMPFNEEEMAKLDYTNDPVIGEDGKPVEVDTRLPISPGEAHKKDVAAKERQEQVINVREAAKKLDLTPYRKNASVPRILAQKFDLSAQTVKKYLDMTDEEVEALRIPRENHPRLNTGITDYKNIIFRMMSEDRPVAEIACYVKYKGCTLSDSAIIAYMEAIQTHHFPARSLGALHALLSKTEYPEGITVISRTALARHLFTIDDEKKDKSLDPFLPLILEAYPICTEVRDTYRQFHDAIMGNDPEAIDRFIEDHKTGVLKNFVQGLQHDLASIHNAIRLPDSSGFVEGCNNKMKVIKRLFYGRSKQHNLEVRLKLAYLFCREGFDIYQVFPWLNGVCSYGEVA